MKTKLKKAAKYTVQLLMVWIIIALFSYSSHKMIVSPILQAHSKYGWHGVTLTIIIGITAYTLLFYLFNAIGNLINWAFDQSRK